MWVASRSARKLVSNGSLWKRQGQAVGMIEGLREYHSLRGNLCARSQSPQTCRQ